MPSFVVTLAGLLAWQGALLYVLGDTGTVNLTDGKITGLANTFYSRHASAGSSRMVAIAAYAGRHRCGATGAGQGRAGRPGAGAAW